MATQEHDPHRITDPTVSEEERTLDTTLRPRRLEEFVGQRKVVENLRIFLQAAKLRQEPLEHVLLSGPPGLGKTTLAHILAQELEADLRATSGPVLERAADLAGVLTNLAHGDVLFIDEVHRLHRVVEECLYPAIEDFEFDILIDRGPAARTVKLTLAPFTMVAATTRAGMVSSPLRGRFGVTFRLDYYASDDLLEILRRSARLLEIPAAEEGLTVIASRSRGTPRVANRLLRRVRDFAQVEGDGTITRAIAERALGALEVDARGLDDMDVRILESIVYKFAGGPVGLSTLSVSVGEEADTIEEVYEPYLVMEGFIQRTPRGRVATPAAYAHLGAPEPSAADRPSLFSS